MEGICGRMCDACTWKEQLDCPGCQDGPGRRFSGGCPIADCCREKGHTACVTCTFSTGCALRRRDMPQNRLWAVEAERERRARLDRNAPVLAKWLWLLFWLVIPSVFSNILTMDTVAGAFPTAGVVGNVLAFLISLAYGVLLWQLREAAGRYRTAALCYLAGGIISGVLLLPAIPEGNWLWWLLSLPVMVLELCAAYQEFYQKPRSVLLLYMKSSVLYSFYLVSHLHAILRHVSIITYTPPLCKQDTEQIFDTLPLHFT